jgi:hypothetical protein
MAILPNISACFVIRVAFEVRVSEPMEPNRLEGNGVGVDVKCDKTQTKKYA